MSHRISEFPGNVTAMKNNVPNEDVLNKVIVLYENLGKNLIGRLAKLYTNDVYFEDPAHAIQGINALTEYFDKLFHNVETCQFRFHNTLFQADKLFLCWTMTLQHKRLKSGKKIFIEGASLLKVRDGKVYYHRDYFDLGSMLYEHIPLLGRLVRYLKKGLSS